MNNMKRIRIVPILASDIITIENYALGYMVYDVFCNDSYVGEVDSKRELCVLLAGLKEGLLEKDYVITVEPFKK